MNHRIRSKQMTWAPTIPQTIMNQLGGAGKFAAMTGAKRFASGYDYVTFQLPASVTKTSAVRIDLTPADEYRVTFYKGRGVKMVEDKVIDGVQVSNLRQVFESHT